MSPKSLKEYSYIVARRYKIASYKKKVTILSEYCKVTGFHRKHAIRKLNNFKFFVKPKKKKPGRKPHYDQKPLIKALKKIWLSSNLPCSKLLKTIIPIWLPHYLKTEEYLESDIIQNLNKISPATIDRLLKPVRFKFKKKGRCCTKPGSLLRNMIPIKTEQWNESTPGFIEADTVHHCGETALGPYALTVNYTDIATGWTEQRAVWGKGESGIIEQTKDVELSLPFPILGFDSDNGKEFINEHLFKYFTGRPKNPVQFTRSRAYKKNDNSHIEQKNWTHIRQWLGYERFDHIKLVDLLNELYKSQWRLYHNFFIPSVKLTSKERIGSKVVKHYGKPKTPYQRTVEADSKYVSDAVKEELTKIYQSLNPFELRQAMEKRIAKIFNFVHKLHASYGNVNFESTKPFSPSKE